MAGSVRNYAVLYFGAGRARGGGVAVGGGNVLSSTPTHKLDGVEHAAADDTSRLDATVARHGLLPKLSGDAGDALLGDGSWGAIATSLGLDDLTDVVITSPTVADRLRYSGSAWVNSSLHWQVLFDGTGSAILAGTGDPIETEVP